ncbi:hypothetical protein [Paenibacillus sp. FSL R5-0519]|uniref:hypothetical protein n=1 Tax=Paenibacillus sp. FSL R5-0519 TaxID=2921648 RepID=UPI0030D86EE4
MSNRKLTKFPVIAEDGTGLRVTIKEDEDYIGYIGFSSVVCRLYIPRKRFGYRRLYSTRYVDERGSVYNESNPDYIAIARQVYEDYRTELHDHRVAALESSAQAQRKSAAIDAFQAWDGRL